MIVVLDAGAVIAYLQGEAGGDVVDQLLLDPATTCVIHAVNLYEVFYDIWRRTDQSTARAVRKALRDAGIAARDDLDDAFMDDAARLKVIHKLAVADTLAIALARRLDTELLTVDHHEMDAVAAAGECRCRFIR